MAIDLTALKARYLAVNFIALALIASVFVYAGVVEFIRWQQSPFAGFAKLPEATVTLLRYVFLILAGTQYVVIRVVQKLLLAQSLHNLPQAAIISLALCETVAVLGLVLFLLDGIATDFYIFMTISLAFFYLYFPKYDQWEKLVTGQDAKKGR